MKPRFTPSDVERWVVQNAKKRMLLERRLGADWRSATDARGLSLLSLTMADEGYTATVLGNRLEAESAFRESVAIATRILEMGRQAIGGAEAYVRTGMFPTLLTASAIGDDSLTKQFVEVFDVDGPAATESPEDSTYIARVLKALVERRVEAAGHILATPIPEVDSQFYGYIPCLRSIAESRWSNLETELQRAADSWERFVRIDCPGHPQSAFFLDGLGLLKLAEKLNGRSIDVEIEQLPALL